MSRVALTLLVAVLAIAAPPASAAVHLDAQRIVVTGERARATIQRSPFRLAFTDARGRTVLSEVPGGGQSSLLVPPVPQLQFGTQSPPPRALYAPLAFLVGTHNISQQQSFIWEGNLSSVQEGGIEYAASNVLAVRIEGSGVRLTLSTSDPSGRKLEVDVAPGPKPGSMLVSARPIPATGVAAMSDSFASPPGEAFHGFGGRHNSLDQHGSEFYNWLQQENLSSGSASGWTTVTPGGPSYLFPNGSLAAYYVQSSFISSAPYGFLLDRNEISHWRMDSDRPDTWQTEVAAPGIDYVVAPGDASQAIRTLTSITGRQPVPPRWAVGPTLDREVKYPSDPPDQYEQEVRGDLRDIRRYDLPLDAYRIEGWQFLPRDVLSGFIGDLRRLHIHPLLYFRAFVGQDQIGTDDPAAYDEALSTRYVATHADGSPYIFISNFSKPAAVIDFTNPAAVSWWQGRIRAALELGADGFMQDFGEQVLAGMHFHDGETGATMHNRLPVLYHQATRGAVSAFERQHPGRRIFFYTRAGYTGTPGSAAYEGGNFPGDETTDWTHSSGLASLTTDMLNRAVGGAYGYSTDIGGFFDIALYQPTSKELFLRWAEWAALSPFFRLHGSVGAGVHAPWTYDAETLQAYIRLSLLHERARPLILRLWEQARRTGIPITRPLWLDYPGDPRAAGQDQEWLLGPNVLVAPVVQEGAVSRTVYFPPGCWRAADPRALYRGPRKASVPAPITTLPYFVRCHTHPFGP